MDIKRADIQDKYKWDLSLVLDSDKSFLKLIEEIQAGFSECENFKGCLNSKESIVRYFEKSREIELKLARVNLYAFLKYEADSLNSQNLKDVERVDNLCVKFSSINSFATPELSKLSDEFLLELKNDKELERYNRIFENIIRNKPHTLDEKQEKLISEMGAFSDFSAVYDMLTDNEIEFEDVVDNDGNKTTLNQSTYGEFKCHQEGLRVRTIGQWQPGN